MDTDSASIDITDIKRILLQAREVENSCPLSRTLTTNCVVFPQYSILGQSDSEQSTVDNETVRAIRAHYDQLSPQRALPSQNTWPTLPSTVPDSQQIHLSTDVESQFRFIHPALPSALNAIITSLAPATMSQVDDALTQELSPSHFDSYIHKSRSARQLEGGVEDDINYIHAQQTDETQFTLHEGDEGHIDLVSSLEQRLEGVNDHDSDPPDKDFSPTQSEPALSQFPESQRFKTPATAGKKRRYNGDAIDTPLLPRNLCEDKLCKIMVMLWASARHLPQLKPILRHSCRSARLICTPIALRQTFSCSHSLSVLILLLPCACCRNSRKLLPNQPRATSP